MSTQETLVSTNMEAVFDETGLLSIPHHLGEALSKHTVTTVDEYPSPGSKEFDEQGRPLAFRYPGQRPETSFSVVGSNVEACAVQAENGLSFYINTASVEEDGLVFNLDDFLRSVEAATMEERYPVIAFGSNANPGQLAQKFKKLEGADRAIVPTMMAKVRKVVPVYSARIGINGYVFTDLFPASEDVESSVHVNFLSKHQLEAMDATEKAYGLCELTNVVLEAQDEHGHKTNAYLYVGREDDQGADILTDSERRPIRLAEITTSGEKLTEQFAVMSQAEVQRYIFQIAGDNIADNLKLSDAPSDEVELAKLIIDRKDEPRLDAFRAHIKENEDGQPLGRMVGRYIQRAIAATGRTAPTSGLRKIIPEEVQDIQLENARTFGELSEQ